MSTHPIFEKNHLSPKKAGELLEKYYEGGTSVSEEQLLYVFLSQKNIPESFETDRDILLYFANRRKKTTHRVHHSLFFRFTVAAAALLGVALLLKTLPVHNAPNYAYIDGRKYSDFAILRQQALFSIQTFESTPDEVETVANEMDDEALMDKQFEVFTNN